MSGPMIFRGRPLRKIRSISRRIARPFRITIQEALMKIHSSSTFSWAAFGVVTTLAILILSFPVIVFGQRLPTTVIPSHYTLKLAPDLKAATFSGEEAIDVILNAPSRTVTLNSIEISFQAVTIDSNGSQQTGAVSLDAGKQQATFTFPETIPAGNATIKI